MTTLNFDDLIPSSGDAPSLSFDDLIPAAPPQGRWSASPAAAGATSSAGVGAAADTYDESDRLAARYPAPVQKGFFEQLGDSFGVGVDQAGLSARVINTTAQDAAIKRVQDQLASLEASGQGTSAQAQGLRKTLDHYTKRQGSYIADVAGRSADMATAPVYEGVRRLGQAKSFGEGWDVLMSDPLRIIANLGVQSSPTMLPGLAAGLVNPALGAGVMGASSFGVELGSSLLQFAGENGVNTGDPDALTRFYSDPAMLDAAKQYAMTRAGIIGAADTAGAGLAAKTLAPASMGPLARGVTNMAVQIPTQAATGAAGEAGAQLATDGGISAPGEVLAEAAGGMFTAPLEVASMATGVAREQRAREQQQAANDGVPEQELSPAQVLADTIAFNANRAMTDQDAVDRAVVQSMGADNAQVQMAPERPDMPTWVAQGGPEPSIDFSDLVPTNMPAEGAGQMGTRIEASAGPGFDAAAIQQMLPGVEMVGNTDQQQAPDQTNIEPPPDAPATPAQQQTPEAAPAQAPAAPGAEQAAASSVPNEGAGAGVEAAGVAQADDYEARVADLPEAARQRLVDLQRRMDPIGFKVRDGDKDRVIGMDHTLRSFRSILGKDGEDAAMAALAKTEDRVAGEESNFFWNNVARRYIDKFDEVPKSDRQIKEAILSGGISVAGEPWAAAAYRHYKVDPAKIKRSEAPADDPVAQLINRFRVGQFGLPRVAGNVSDKQAMADAEAANKRFADAYNEAVRRFLEGPMDGAAPTKASGEGFSVAIGNDLTGVSPQPVEKTIKPVKGYEAQLKAMDQIAAKKDIRFYLNGIMLDEANGRMAATDGHRLAVFYTDLKGRIPVRPEGVSGDVIVNAKGEWATDDSRGTRFAKPIDGKFPDVDRVIPKVNRTRDASASAAEVAAKARGIVKANKFVNAKNAFPITVQVDGRAYAFEAQYILDMAELFQRMGYERFSVNLGASDDVTSSSAILATSPDGKLQQVVMPKRWQDKRQDVDPGQMFYAPIVLAEGSAVGRPVAASKRARAAKEVADFLADEGITDPAIVEAVQAEYDRLGETDEDAEAGLAENADRPAQRGAGQTAADALSDGQQDQLIAEQPPIDRDAVDDGRPAASPRQARGTDQPEAGAVNGRAPVSDRRNSSPAQEDRPRGGQDDGAQANQRVRGAGQERFVAASFTRRQSVWRDAFTDIGIDPTVAENLPPARQLEILKAGLANKFGLKFVERSNRLQIRDAIDQLLDAYRGMQFMANVLDLPSEAIGLRGTLGLALISEGKGFLGAYAPTGISGKAVDGLSLDGASLLMPGRSNSFAHEWGHALDFFVVDKYQGAVDNLSGMIRSGQALSDQFPDTVRDSFRLLMNALFFDQAEQSAKIMDLERRIEAAALRGVDATDLKSQLQRILAGASQSRQGRSQMVKSAAEFARSIGSDPAYWTKPTEMLARSFEAYIAHKVEAAGGTTEFIAKGDYAYLDNADERLALTFPKDADRFNIFRAYDMLFDAMRAESLLGEGPAATKPDNVRLSDPMIYFDSLRGEVDTPAWRRAVDEEMRAFQLRKRQIMDIDGRPDDTRSLAKRLSDPLRSFLQTNRGVLLTMMRQYRDNPRAVKAIKDVFSRIATNPGAGWQTFKDGTFSESVDRNFRRFQTRLSNIVRSNGIDLFSDAERKQLVDVMTAIGVEPLLASPKINKAAAELRELVNDLYYYNRGAGLEIGFVENGYMPRLIDAARVTEEADQFIKDAARVYTIIFERDTPRPGDEGVDLAEAITALDARRKEAMIDRRDPTLAPYFDAVRKFRKLSRALEAATAEGDGDAIAAAQAALDQFIDENIDIFSEAYAYVRDAWSRDAAADYQTRIAYGSPTSFSSHSPSGSFLKSRTLPAEADKILARYYIQNPVERLSTYIEQSVRKAEYNRRFGPSKSGGNTQLHQMLEAMVESGVRREDRDMVEKIVGQVTGTDRSSMPNQAVRLLGAIHALGQMTLLGRVVLTSLAEPITTAVQTGRPADMLRSLALTIQEIVATGSIRERRKLANVMGIVSGDLADEIISNRLGGNFGESGMMQRASASFFRRVGLTGLTNAQRRAAMVLGGRYVLDMAHTLDDADAKPTDKAHAKAELLDAGLTEDQIQDFVEWSREFAGRNPRADELVDLDGSLTAMGKAYSIMVGRLVNQSIQNPTAIDRPYAANTPFGRLTYGLLSFTMAFWRNVVIHAGKKAKREIASRGPLAGAAYTAWSVLTPMAGLYLGHLLVTAMREAMLNPEKWEEQEEKGELAPWLMSLAFSRSGFTGLADPLYNALTGVKYQRDLANIFTGPALSFFAQAMQRIATFFVLNSENTNSAERAAAQGAYEALVMPAMAFGVGYLPGGPMIGYGLGASYAYMSSPKVKEQVKTIVAGPKDDSKARTGEGGREQEAGF
jgi:hypothetical protein